MKHVVDTAEVESGWMVLKGHDPNRRMVKATLVISDERVFTESEVRAIMGPLLALSSARLSSITVKGVEYMEAENVEFAFARLKDIAVRLGLYFDPA